MNNPQFKNSLSVPFIIPRNISDNELREWLIDKMAEIDAVKRSVTEQMSRHHTKVKPKDREGNFYTWIKRVKSFKSHLTEERERLRSILGEVNAKIKENRILKNKRLAQPNFAQFFMIAAEDLLDDEMYRQIEFKTHEIFDI